MIASGSPAGARSSSGGAGETPFEPVPPTCTSVARPGHIALMLAVAASCSSPASGDTITSSRLSADAASALPARIAATSAADSRPVRDDGASSRSESATRPSSSLAAESNTTTASPGR